MTKRDTDVQSDDGIIAEDITQLMEHVELTGERRLVDGPGWELAPSADDLEDAPIFVDDYSELIPADLVPDLEATAAAAEVEDLELFTETELDLNRRLSQVEDEQLMLAAGIGAERARWQKRVVSLRMDMTERNRQLAEREQEIEDLSARLASLAVERDVFVEELRELQRSVGQAEANDEARAPSPADAVITSLHDRLSERGRALLAMREEIDRLRAERDQLVASIAERDEFIQSLLDRLNKLEGDEKGGELRKLMRRFFGGEPKEAAAAPAPEVATPDLLAPEAMMTESVTAEPAAPVAAAPTMELPIMDMPAFELPELQVAAPVAAAPELTAEIPQRQVVIEDMQQVPPKAELPASLRMEPGVRRYLIGLDMVGSVFELTLPRINIGRTRDNDLRIVDPTVSRLHAVLKTRGREVSVIDANSRNGVFVNGIQLRYAKIEDGDTLTFGAVRFRYRVGSGSSGGDFKPG